MDISMTAMRAVLNFPVLVYTKRAVHTERKVHNKAVDIPTVMLFRKYSLYLKNTSA